MIGVLGQRGREGGKGACPSCVPYIGLERKKTRAQKRYVTTTTTTTPTTRATDRNCAVKRVEIEGGPRRMRQPTGPTNQSNNDPKTISKTNKQGPMPGLALLFPFFLCVSRLLVLPRLLSPAPPCYRLIDGPPAVRACTSFSSSCPFTCIEQPKRTPTGWKKRGSKITKQKQKNTRGGGRNARRQWSSNIPPCRAVP